MMITDGDRQQHASIITYKIDQINGISAESDTAKQYRVREQKGKWKYKEMLRKRKQQQPKKEIFEWHMVHSYATNTKYH